MLAYRTLTASAISQALRFCRTGFRCALVQPRAPLTKGGKITVNVAPPPSRSPTSIRPPWAATVREMIAMPSPAPAAAVPPPLPEALKDRISLGKRNARPAIGHAERCRMLDGNENGGSSRRMLDRVFNEIADGAKKVIVRAVHQGWPLGSGYLNRFTATDGARRNKGRNVDGQGIEVGSFAWIDSSNPRSAHCREAD